VLASSRSITVSAGARAVSPRQRALGRDGGSAAHRAACQLAGVHTGLVAGCCSQSIRCTWRRSPTSWPGGADGPRWAMRRRSSARCGSSATAAISRASRWRCLPIASKEHAVTLPATGPARAPRPTGPPGAAVLPALPRPCRYRVLRAARRVHDRALCFRGLALGLSTHPDAAGLGDDPDLAPVVAAALVPAHLSADYSPGELVLSTGPRSATESGSLCGCRRVGGVAVASPGAGARAGLSGSS